jgi:hypothetical protein
MVWLADEKTRSQRVKTMMYGAAPPAGGAA